MWLLLISIGLFAILILIPSGKWLPEVASESGKLLLKLYNTISHLFSSCFSLQPAYSCFTKHRLKLSHNTHQRRMQKA
ncbi:hypothetical protein SynA15127_00199 [Synechococcus sp. A15-127]|nr:hypothetical protein SynA15127_00199 [Synechococcus sp. A15-127]